MSDFLRSQTSGELAGWLAYLQVDDKATAQRTAYEILQSIGALKPAGKAGPQANGPRMIDGEPVIDTTDPNFAKNFKGFIVGNPPPKRTMSATNLEIKHG